MIHNLWIVALAVGALITLAIVIQLARSQENIEQRNQAIIQACKTAEALLQRVLLYLPNQYRSSVAPHLLAVLKEQQESILSINPNDKNTLARHKRTLSLLEGRAQLPDTENTPADLQKGNQALRALMQWLHSTQHPALPQLHPLLQQLSIQLAADFYSLKSLQAEQAGKPALAREYLLKAISQLTQPGASESQQKLKEQLRARLQKKPENRTSDTTKPAPPSSIARQWENLSDDEDDWQRKQF